MNRLIIVILIFILGCSQAIEEESIEENTREWVPEPDKDLRLEYERNEKFFAMSNDSLWRYLAFEKSGCLTGGQYIKNNTFGGEGCVMTRQKEWEIFSNREKNDLTEFLISKLSKTDTTKIHTCPFFLATEGELAIYTLQKLHKKNWYDFEDFIEYKDRKTTSSLDNPQSWLQKILENTKQREKMIESWKKEINNK